MTGPAEQPALPTGTEETPEVPGWAEKSVRDIFAALPVHDGQLDTIRDAYLDCLAGAGRTQDLDMEHDRCRQQAISAVENAGLLPAARLEDLDQRLAALEADITANL
ncbi:hypothetical protein CFR75_06725 [Komagataeibacter xylinus]|uniref:Uncharacterized protein n=1 Tax=Komagataeibacter xylinus TaxID=28448 RepID=A0A318PIV2_KOMXY|nr:hypothetical protein [Komagataeibacter xylinus]AZV38701.1 hypothetical protein CXP35_07680 [Komagataeibacter xylinus]PYD57286.1 hypothetical protein CFR75_06725 [Komagataeibacter xylinus]GBQ77612.1 hypothetical protein AA15237_2601 [Komagataeibacter xylinus NBRC 15237]